MDAAEADLDVKLQRISADLIADLDASLPLFLRQADGQGGSRVRSWVRSQETFRLNSHVSTPFSSWWAF